VGLIIEHISRELKDLLTRG